MTSANRTELLIYEQTDFDTLPTGTPKFQSLRFTKEGFSPQSATEASEEIEDTNQISDSILTDMKAVGSLDFELSIGSYNQLLRALLLHSAAVPASTALATAVTVVSVTGGATQRFTTTGTWTAPAVGSWIRATGFATAGNSGCFKVKASTTTTIDVEGARLTTEAAGATVTLTAMGDITNGTDEVVHYLERHNKDLISAEQVTSFESIVPSQMTLTIPTSGKVTGSFSFMGRRETPLPSGTLGDGSPTVKTTAPILTALNVETTLENHVPVEITSLDLSGANGYEARGAVGILGAHSLRKGAQLWEGTIQTYLDTRTRTKKMIDQTESSIAVVFVDGDGGCMVIEYPRIKFTTAESPTTGKGADVYETAGFRAFKHETELITVRIAIL